MKSKSGCIGLFPKDLNFELKNRLKKSDHASVMNLKKSASSANATFNKSHCDIESSTDSEDISPEKNLAAALRSVMTGACNIEENKSTSEGESSGGREISEIIKNSAIARKKKHNDGWVSVFS